MSGTHALFAPSKASVWSNCPGALALSKDLPEEPSSVHAASGTFTHSIAERILNEQGIGAMVYQPGLAETHDGFEFKMDPERWDRAVQYAQAVRARGGQQFYEVKLPVTPVIPVEQKTGTSDAVVVHLDRLELESHDLKDGNRQVSAQNNEQLIMYLLMAMHEFESCYFVEFQKFTGFIHQPKIGWSDECSYTRAELLAWQDKFRKAAARGWDLMHESPAKINAALNAGAWCDKGWCRMRGQCPAKKQQMMTILPDTKVATYILTPEQVGEILAREKDITEWFSQLRGAALNMLKMGQSVPGWKLADGRQGPRKWASAAAESAASDLMFEAIEHETYVKEVISPTVAEKKLKKKFGPTWEALQQYITRSEGQVSLVPDSDLRPAIALGAEFETVDDASDLI